MLSQSSSLKLVTNNIFNMQCLADVLEKINNVLFIPYDYITGDCKDVSYNCISEIKVQLRSIVDDDISKIVSNLETSFELNIALIKSLQMVISNNEDLFTVSEILSHGITYCDSTEKIKTTIANLKQLIDGFLVSKFDSTSEVIQIGLDNDNLDSFILKILKNINKKIVIIPSINGRGVLSAFLLVYLMHQQSSDLKHKITFILPQDHTFVGNYVLCSESWIDLNRKYLTNEKVFNIEFDERKSCFFILGNSNLFSAVVNYVNLLGGTFSNTRKVPQLCLIQENIYVKFVSLLKTYLLKSKDIKLLDRNRQMTVNYCENVTEYEKLLKTLVEDPGLNLLSEAESCEDYKHFFPTIVVDKCQPQQKLFNDKFANKFCSFLLTFRTCQEGIMLANQLYEERDSIYLWTESISQCFSLKKQLNYDEIFVNVAQNYAMLTGEMYYKYTCTGTFFLQKETKNDSKSLSVNDISEKFITLKSTSTWRSESFYRRYSRVIEIINKMVAAGFLSNDGAKSLLEYLENTVKPYQFNYLIRDSLNKLTESFPVGGVIVDLGETDINDRAIETILLVWLFGNDLVVVSVNDLSALSGIFVDGSNKSTLAFVRGRLYLDVVAECSFVGSVICFDESIADHGFIDDQFPMRLLYRSADCLALNMESFNEIVSFVRKQKSLYILSGDVGIN